MNVIPGFSEPIRPPSMGRHQPREITLTILIYPDTDGSLDVTLLISLDPARHPERLAIENCCSNSLLEIHHSPRANLTAERNALSRNFGKIYRQSIISQDLCDTEFISFNDDTKRSDRLKSAMMSTATIGRSVFRRLLIPEELFGFRGEFQAIAMNALRSALTRSHVIHIRSPVSLFPWAFLYDGEELDKDNLATLDYSRFWGFRHQIQDQARGTSSLIYLPDAPSMTIAVCPERDAESRHENGPLGEYSRERSTVTWLTSAQDLRNALTKFPDDCLYFFGHSHQEQPPISTTSRLRLGSFDVTVDEVIDNNGPSFNKPLVLVFLNSCETTPLNDWNEDSFIGMLCLRGGGSVCCISTFAEVPVEFALQFGERLWTHFMNGFTLGASLLQARREILRDFGNPLGLLYTILGRIETRIRQASPSVG